MSLNQSLKTVKTANSPGGAWEESCLPMQRTQVRSLVQEDLTGRGQLGVCATTTEACTLQGREPQLRSPSALEPVRSATREAATKKNPRTTTRQEPLLPATRGGPHAATDTAPPGVN